MQSFLTFCAFLVLSNTPRQLQFQKVTKVLEKHPLLNTLPTLQDYTSRHDPLHIPELRTLFVPERHFLPVVRLIFCTFGVLLNTSCRRFFRAPQYTSRELKKVHTFEHFSPFRFCFYCHKDVPGLLPLIRTGYQRQGCLTTCTSYSCFKQRQRFRLCYISLQFLRTVKRCLLEAEHGHISFQYCRYPVLFHAFRRLKEHAWMSFPVLIGGVLIHSRTLPRCSCCDRRWSDSPILPEYSLPGGTNFH